MPLFFLFRYNHLNLPHSLSNLPHSQYNLPNRFSSLEYQSARRPSDGTITISSINSGHVKGTFSFKAKLQNNDGTYNNGNVKNITEGSFDLHITNY